MENETFVTFYGTLGTGRAYHPWDDLALCSKCGGYPYMVGKDGQDFHSGPPYRIKCLECGCSSISSDDISLIRKDWMDMIDGKGGNK